MSNNLHDDIVDLWDDVIPKLIAYLEKNSSDTENWNQNAWEVGAAALLLAGRHH